MPISEQTRRQLLRVHLERATGQPSPNPFFSGVLWSLFFSGILWALIVAGLAAVL